MSAGQSQGELVAAAVATSDLVFATLFLYLADASVGVEALWRRAIKPWGLCIDLTPFMPFIKD